jgi:hypothetical protein
VGHTDQGWRCAVNGGSGAVGFDSGNGLDVRSTSTYNDGNWHQIVGVYDGASNTLVYVDGALAGSGFKAGVNAIQTSFNVYLASSPNGQSNVFGGRSFAGNICEAAIWNSRALSSNDVQNLYNAAEALPFIVTQPISASANQNASFTNSVVAGGSKPLAYQWYKNNLPLPLGGQTNIPAGATNASLILNPVLPSDQSLNYYVVVTNNYGSVTSVVWALNPVFTLPVFTNEPVLLAHTNTIKLFTTAHPTFKVGVSGAIPLFYQWFTNGVAATAQSTNNTGYTLPPLTAPGVTNVFCVASNFLARTTNTPINIIALPVPPLYYPAAVLASQPMGYWRLNESDDGLSDGNAGAIADDYWGAQNGIFTNTLLGLPGYGPCLDSGTTSAQFDTNSAPNSMAYGIGGIDFSTTNGTSAAFSIEAWAYGAQSTADAAIVDKGYGGGGEEFCLDSHSQAFRFFVRNAAGTAPNATAPIAPDNNWHHLVGVCDEANHFIALYVDGVLKAKTGIAPNSGINSLSATNPITIGSRPSSADPSVNDLEWNGRINDVAIYNRSLGAAEIASHYFAAGIPPLITVNPAANTNVNENGTLIVPAAATGSAPLAYQWFDATTSAAVPNATNATLVINSFPIGLNGETYYLAVSNLCGSNATTTVSVNVETVLAFVVDLPPQVTTVAGATYTYAPVVSGTQPFAYQWFNGPSPIIGQTGPTYSFPVTPGNYSVVVTNTSGAITSVVSVLSVVNPLATPYALALQNVGPVAYWPLNETIQPPVADIETNLGSFGSLGNAYYESSAKVQKQQPGALAGDADTAITLDGSSGSWLGVPRTDPRLTLSNSFSVECWVNPADTAFAALVSQATPFGASTVGYRGDANVNGWSLYQNGGAPGNFSFHLYNGVSGGGIEPKEFAIYNAGSWQHVVAVFDGTQVILYVNGQNQASALLSSVSPAIYAPNYWAPVQIGGSGLDHNVLNGSIDEVAVYSNALSPSQVFAHFQAGTNVAVSNYKAVVLADNPYLYYRMDSPTYTGPSTTNNPPAVNYGSGGPALNGSYLPATLPGQAGPPSVAFGNNKSVAINGLNSCVVIPYNSVLDPTLWTPFTVSAWFRGNPADGAGRWENIIGHSDQSWVFHMNNCLPDFDIGFNAANSDINVATNLVNANDGNWHFFAGTYDGAYYTIYLDTFSSSNTVSSPGMHGTNLDIYIGGDQQFTNTDNTVATFNERYLPGNVAQVAWFTNALTPAQIAQLYSVGTNKIPFVKIAFSGGNSIITYAGTLQTATNVTGPYLPVAGANSPYTAPAGPRRFYRSSYP